jgi:orotate phosphoribosyltransferase
MMDEMQIMKEFEAAGAILRGHFLLSSGLHSDTYIQCARVLMNPGRAEKLCGALADRVRDQIKQQIDLVVAPAMGGVVVGYEMGRQLGVEAIFCERENGQFALRRGFEIFRDANVLLVEDVVTTGRSSLETVECVKEHGGKVIAEACLIDRSAGQTVLPFPLISLLQLKVATFQPENLPERLRMMPAVKPGSRNLNAG